MSSQSVEDYLEAIYRIIEQKGYARTTDLAILASTAVPVLP